MIQFIKLIFCVSPVILFGVNITFQVDMADESVNPSCPPSISGSFFNSWSWYENLSYTENNIWSINLSLDENEYYEYKFGNCEWNLESLPEGSPCTNTNFGYTNRFINTSEDDIIVEPFIFGSCDISDNNENNAEWTLIWSDEFDSPNIDINKWSYDIGTGDWGWGNNEEQYYTNNSNNSFIEDGKLIIQALLQNYGGSSYTSARMVTKNKGDWKYGRIEVRAKIPSGIGTWPAIWMLPTDWVYGGWPYSGEIDVMEHVGYNPNVIHGTAHTEEYNWYNGQPPPSGTINISNALTDFNNYIIEWNQNSIKWYVNDTHYFTYLNNDVNESFHND